MSLDVHLVTENVGGLGGTAVWPLCKIPTLAGGITIQNAEVTMGGSIGCQLRLVTLGTSGTAASGTVTTTALSGAAVGVPQAFTISTPFVAEGQYFGIQNSGTACNAITQVSFAYVMGRAY